MKERSRTTRSVSGGIKVNGVKFQIGSHLAGTLVTIVRDETTIAFYDITTGELLIEHPWPEPGIRYVSDGMPRGPRRTSDPSRIVTNVLTHEVSPLS